MPHRFVLISLVSTPFALLAAPIPPPEDNAAKIQRLYGMQADPLKDSKFELTGSRLRIAVPATDHKLSGSIDTSSTAPTALREVEGDFTAVVRVSFPIPDRGPRNSGIRYFSGGLLAWEAEREYVVIRRSALTMEGVGEAMWAAHQCQEKNFSRFHGSESKEQMAFLRLKREGQKILTAWSRSGKRWTEFQDYDVNWGVKVKVGVVAENIFQIPVSVTFDEYSLTRPK